jgi:LacI family transcriptional regulator, galactose operon repressor
VKKKKRLGQNVVTLHDVAKRARVSPMTVSRFIGNKRDVKDSARVKAAIEELGYLPNAAARSLASAKALKIGLIYGNPSASFTSEFLVVSLEHSSRMGCQLLLERCTSTRNEAATAQKLIRGGVDGVILPTPMCDSQSLMRHFDKANVVTVAVGTGREDAKGLSLRIDNFAAAQEMTRYLLSLGHRDIGFIRGHPRQIDSVQRFDGFVAALTAAGVKLEPSRVKQGLYTYQSGFVAAAELLEGKHRPTAIFASNDDMAAGTLAAAHRLRLDVPNDLSIVGFDDTPLATTIWPSLTTIRQPVEELTRLGLTMLVKEVLRRREGGIQVPKQESVKLTLVKRASTAPQAG